MTATVIDMGSFAFDEDAVLVERFLAGDQSAFDSIYSRYHEKVYVISKGILLDPDDAADAVQEAFTLIFRHLPRFNRRSKLSTWIFRIAVNSAIQRSRRLKHRSKLTSLDEASEYAAEVAEPDMPGVDLVSTAMARLRIEDRAILTLFYWEDLSLNEIAAALSCGANAAKTRLYRARERFREHFEALGGRE
jgi:RNA polymerase sigma-70 factor (ECF subfamily)